MTWWDPVAFPLHLPQMFSMCPLQRTSNGTLQNVVGSSGFYSGPGVETTGVMFFGVHGPRRLLEEISFSKAPHATTSLITTQDKHLM